MATYAIGDIQGCFEPLVALLDSFGFDADRDRLWLVGDLVNRGPASLQTLRFIRQLGERAVCVLGNHDLHLIAVAAGCAKLRKDDTLQDVLDAPDREELIDWLRHRQLMHRLDAYAMVHAGLLPDWSIEAALGLAGEVEQALRAPHYRKLLENMYGNDPDHWDPTLSGFARLRVIVNAMTRMRFCDRNGRMDLQGKGTEPAKGYLRWYETRPKEARTLVFGHWSQLGLVREPAVVGLDSGCVWGGGLSAFRLEDRTLYQVPCPGYQKAGGEG